jgi:hypothetical protein
MVGLPTLVQNPPIPNDIGNPTGLDRQLSIVRVAGCGRQPDRLFQAVSKKMKKKKKMPRSRIELTDLGI